MENGKVSSTCGISAEMLNAGRMVVVNRIHRTTSYAWDT